MINRRVLVIILCFSSLCATARPVKYVRMHDKVISYIPISPNGAILSFPSKPEKIILGRKNAFSVEYVKSDLAISPLRSNSRSNLFVYLPGRRLSFHLYVAEKSNSTLILIGDSKSNQVKVKYDE